MPQMLDRLKTALADRYALEREIGRGGMATVYLALDGLNAASGGFMRTVILALLCATAVTVPSSALAAFSALAAATASASQTAASAPTISMDTGAIDGARYRILVPRAGTRKLVMQAHGYRSPWQAPIDWTPAPTGAVKVFLDAGFSVAQSEYRRQGWAVKEGVEDTEALRKYFVSKYGMPDTTFISGGSMGGLIAIVLIEQFPQHYLGALPVCGVLDGSLSFGTKQVDLLLALEQFFPGAVGTSLDGLATPAAPDTIPVARVRAALNRDLPKAQLIASRFAVETADLPVTAAAAYEMMRTLAVRAKGQPFDNRNTVYGGFGMDSTFNRGVQRLIGDPAALMYVRAWYAPTGKLQRPTLALHNTYDPIVPTSSPNDYSLLVASQGAGRFFVQGFVTALGHCVFSEDQRAVAFNLLRTWVATGARPEVREVRPSK